MTIAASEMTVGERLASMLDELGIERAHFGSGVLAEAQVQSLIEERPQAVASIFLLLAPWGEGVPAFRPWADRLVAVFGTPMLPPQQQAHDLIRSWHGVQAVDLPEDYSAELWADVVRDHPRVVGEGLKALSEDGAVPHVDLDAREGWSHGLRFRVSGSGPALVLLPAGLAPSQWDPVIDDLAEVFTVIRVGGPHVGFGGALESRTASPLAMVGVHTMFDLMALSPGDRVLEVGTGMGTMARALSHRVPGLGGVTAVDLSAFLLDEARALCAVDMPDVLIEFEVADATNLPYPDESFDAAFSVLVYEECDADRAIAELARVVKPGGRAGVTVRSIDLPYYWNLDVPTGIRSKLNAPVATAVSAGGCADASLYERMTRHFERVLSVPLMIPYQPPLPIQRTTAHSLLSADEAVAFDAALERAVRDGNAFVAVPQHCAIGLKAGLG